MDARECVTVTRSVGQANLFSRAPSFARHPSILGCLASRALSGRHLPREIHRHRGQRILLVWNVRRGGDVSEARLVRAFLLPEDFVAFTELLQRTPSVGMRGCVCMGGEHVFWDKVVYCIRALPVTPWLTFVQMQEKVLRRHLTCCGVYAPYTEYLVRGRAALLAFVSECVSRPALPASCLLHYKAVPMVLGLTSYLFFSEPWYVSVDRTRVPIGTCRYLACVHPAIPIRGPAQPCDCEAGVLLLLRQRNRVRPGYRVLRSM